MDRDGREYKARHKKILKHSKEGLKQLNLSKNEVKNISSRIEDVDLEKTINNRKIDSLDFTKKIEKNHVKRKNPQIYIRGEGDKFNPDQARLEELEADEIKEADNNYEGNESNYYREELDIKKDKSLKSKEKTNHQRQYKIAHKGRYKQREGTSNQELKFSKENLDLSKEEFKEKLKQQKRYWGDFTDFREVNPDDVYEGIANGDMIDEEIKIKEDLPHKQAKEKALDKKGNPKDRVKAKSKLKYDKVKESKLLQDEKNEDKLAKKSIKDNVSALGLMGLASKNIYHQKVSEVEDDNIGIESLHKTQLLGERSIRKSRNYSINRRNKRLKKENKEIIQNYKLRNKLEFNQLLKEDKAYQDLKGINKHIQRWRLKQNYYKKRSRKSIGKRFMEGLNGLSKTIKDMTKKVTKKAGVYMIALVFLILLIMVSLQSCSNILMGGLGTIAGTSYQASDIEVTGADFEYTRLETGLLLTLQDIERDNPGYDEYRYELDGVGHDPHELIAYLTAKYGDFSLETIMGELQSVFEEQYKLSLHEFTETYTITETFIDPETGESYEEEVEYEKTILLTKLISSPLEEILLSRLDEDDKKLYEVLMISKGNFMSYQSPVDGDWKLYISSMFGYRIHPIRLVENFHTGLDIAKSEGEPLYAIFDGKVRKVGYDPNGYGSYIIIEDRSGNTALYAHCSEIISNQGSEIGAGDIIAKIGSTGSSTGAHLHLELKDSDGNLLNPYFYLYSEVGSTIGTGVYYNGYRGNYGSPGIPYDDADIRALFTEADKHLGKRYVYGANGPNNFDCSSFVCWVFRNSGIYNIPRTTAQGIFNQSTPISESEARPGDLIFFTGTYNAGVPVTHVGIYAGNGMMVHAGDPIQYTSIDTNYWRNHFYSYGRLR